MAPIPVITTARLLLRPWRIDDLVQYAEMNADPGVRQFMHPARPLTREESDADVEAFVDQWAALGFGHWAVELRKTGELIGRTGAKRHADWDLDPDNSEVGWLYARHVWGQGYATEGAIAAIRFLIEDMKRPEVISIAHVENVASHQVMKKAGLSWAGMRRWHERQMNVVWYSSRGKAEKTEPRTARPPVGHF